jgi:hypothetical protein
LSDFLREVDEDYRRDQLLNLWKRYGSWLIGAAILTVIAVAGFKAWNAHVSEQRQARAEIYETALNAVNDGRINEAFANLVELQNKGSEGYGVLSRLAQAKLLVLENKVGEAVTLYDAVAADSDAPKVLQDLAIILSASAQFDMLSGNEMQERLALLAQSNSGWAALANELIAMSYLRESREEEAREILNILSVDPTAPPGVKARANNVLAVLGPAPSIVDEDVSVDEEKEEDSAK